MRNSLGLVRKSFVFRIRVLAGLAVVAAFSLVVLFQSEAWALCLAQPEAGGWVNTDVNTRGITRVQLRFVCQDRILNGQPYPPGPPWYSHLWGKCHPTDCDWGEVGGERLGTGHLFFFYNQGFARRYVWARMSQYRPGQLWVYIWTDFTDPGRPDYGMHQWFRRQ